MKPSRRRRHQRQNRWLRPVAVVFGVVASCYSAPYVIAGGMAVIDASNLTQTTATAQKMIQQVQQSIKTVEQLTTLNGAIGVARDTVNFPVPNWNQGMTYTVGNIKPTFDSWNLPKDISAAVTTPQHAQEFITKALDFPLPDADKPVKPRSATDLQRVLTSRKAAQREVSLRALATAQNAESSAADASTNANSILTANNTDLRQQTAQLIQAVVAVNQELIEQRMINASILELLAVNTIHDLPTGVGDTYSDLRSTTKDKGDETNDPFSAQ